MRIALLVRKQSVAELADTVIVFEPSLIRTCVKVVETEPELKSGWYWLVREWDIVGIAWVFPSYQGASTALVTGYGAAREKVSWVGPARHCPPILPGVVWKGRMLEPIDETE